VCPPRTPTRDDRGAAAVELALVTPLLLLILFGIIDFGRMLHAQVTLTEAAREGARAAVVRSSVAARVDAVANALSGPHTVDAVSCPSKPTDANDANVTVRYTFSFVTPIGAIAGMFPGGSFSGADVAMTGRGVMPCRA